MTTESLTDSRKLPKKLRYALVVLALSVFINYIDRGNLSIAAPMLKDEMGLTSSQLGILLSSFFWTYGFFQMVSGWLADRFDVNWVMAIGFFLWSAATGITGLLHGFTAILVARLILGIGESVAYPSYSKILSKYFPESQRGRANSLIASGLASGPAFGMLLGGMLMARFGWRSFFMGVGLISLVWLVPWFWWMPRGPGLAADSNLRVPTPAIEILKQRPAWGSFLGHFCNAYGLYFLIAWLPFYLVRERHFSMDAMAKIGGAVFLTQALSSIVCGRISDRWIALGASRTTVHITLISAGLLGTALFLLVSVLGGPVLSVAMLCLVGASVGVVMASVWPITQTLAGVQTAGQWTGLQCAFGNSSGAVVSLVTGFLLDRTGSFFWAFVVTAVVSVFGVFFWNFMARPIEPVLWKRRASTGLGNAGAEAA